jgi:hypothetical protein
MTHTGLPSTQLQQISTIDPADPQSVYEVNAREARNDEPSIVIQVPESNINVEPTNINVQPPNITFETPNVDVQVAAPNVNVESPTIEVTNTIEQKSVRRKVIRDENNLITEIIEEFVKDEE